MKRNNKGFTLIELLAIIVILAIIAVITVPIILNIIENSRKGAASDSAYGYKDAVNKYYVTELSKPENQNLILSGEYTVSTGGVLNGSGITNKEIPVSGDKPSSGSLVYENNVLKSGCLIIGDYAVTFTDGSVSNTTKGECPPVQYGYKSYDTTSDTEIEIMIGTSNPTGKNIYLKYALTNGNFVEGTVPEACIYSDTYGGELCLKNNDYAGKNGSKSKILDYFGYNANTWTQNVDYTQQWYNSSENPTITCDFDSSNFYCNASTVSANARSDGYVATVDESTGLYCYVSEVGDAECSW